MSKRIVAKLIAIFGIAFFILNACSKTESLPAAQVISNFKNTVKTIDSVDMNLAAVMKGKENTDNIDFNLTSNIKVDRMNEKRNGDISLKIGGSLDAGGQKLDGNLDVRMVSVGDEFYFNISKFDSSDPNTEKIETALKPYMSKWEHLSSDFIPQNIKDLQKTDPEAKQKEDQLKDLFINTPMFEVTKEYGMEKVDGNSVYHYGMKLNKDAVKDYIKKAAVINGMEKTDQEVEDASTFVDSVTDLQMWIGTEDFYLYKGVATLSGGSAENNASSTIDLTFTAKSYNKDLQIKTPEGAEEFNPITLLMGLQLGSDSSDESAPDTEDKDAVAPADTMTPADETAPADDSVKSDDSSAVMSDESAK